MRLKFCSHALIRGLYDEFSEKIFATKQLEDMKSRS